MKSNEMGDNNRLLMMVLKQHYKDRPEILDEALKVVKDYSNKLSNQEEFDKTLSTLRDMMNDLPTIILHHFLTMVPLPNNVSSTEIALGEAMKKIQIPACTNIRLVLLQYLNSRENASVDAKDKECSVGNNSVSVNNNNVDAESGGKCNMKQTKLQDPDFIMPAKHLKTTKPKGKAREKLTKQNESNSECRKLVDLCAEYVIANQTRLQKHYKRKKEEVWSLVNNNVCRGADLLKCYTMIKDINKKAKWMRSIDNEEILQEIIREEYENSDVFLKEQHLSEEALQDPFVISEALQSTIAAYMKN